RERGEGLLRARLTQEDLALLARGVALHGRHVERAREVVADGVEHRLDTAVLERGAAEDRVELRGDGELADARLDLLDRELLAPEVLLHEVVVGLGDALDEVVAVLLGLRLELLRDLPGLVGRT